MKNIVDEVRYSKSAQKFIKTRDANENQRIKDIIENNLKHLPATGDIKPLEGFSDGRKDCVSVLFVLYLDIMKTIICLF